MHNTVKCRPIPFNRSSVVGKEQAYIEEVIATGQVAGDQTFGRKCEAALAAEIGAARVLLTTSCTHALELSGMLLGIGLADEVIIPSFTFVSTANAFAVRGASLVFADIRPDTLNIDPDDIERKIGPRTKAIVVVHYAGIACEMERILAIAGARGIPVVEDNAHGLFGRWHDKPLGSFGCLATQSFHETKNVTCGEGGALVIQDDRLVERAEIIREKGTNRSRYFRGLVDKYTWVDLGSSYVMSDILGAYLYGQLEQKELVQGTRRRIWTTYDNELRSWAAEYGVGVPFVPDGAAQAYHMYYLLLHSVDERQALIERLKERGVQTAFHYLPLHLSEMGRRYGGKEGDCPVTERVADRLLRLPFFFSLSPLDQQTVIREVKDFFRSTRS